MASQDWLEKDFYKILGVAKDVTDAELKKVYRKLARKYHPDSNPGDAKAEAKFKEISEAYSDVGEGDKLAFFNSAGYLEIAINKGNASSLFGLQGYSEKQQKTLGQQYLNSRLFYQTVKVFFE